MTSRDHDHVSWSRRVVFVALVTIAAAVLLYVVRLVDRHTIHIVSSQRLLPRWDLATHLNHGWEDYHLLVTGQIHRLLWDLWLQGYWPPMLSIWQVPFYLILGTGMTPGLISALAAFVLIGLTGSALMWRQWKSAAWLAASLFLALLVSSPYLLAYASVTMTETLGALFQLLVLLAYARYRENRTQSAARLFALSLTTLFFTKYNYFLLLALPFVLHEWLERTAGQGMVERVASVWEWGRRAFASPIVIVILLYLVAVLIIMRTGGFDVRLFGRRISVHTIGNSGHVVLYLLLARLWYLHRRRRVAWDRMTSADPLVRPLLIWFVLPATIWLASPYPNHIRDFANLVINRPLGESTVGGGVAVYVDAIRTTYFYSGWVLACVAGLFLVAVVRYRRQPPVFRWIILAIPIQLAAIAVHQTRFPRFLLLTVVLLCLAAASEVGQWFGRSRGWRVAAWSFAPIVLVAGLITARNAVSEDRFRVVAFENYTDNEVLRAALDSIRTDLTADDRLAIVGQGNELSPALLRWELGPPSGAPCFPFEIGGARGVDLSLASRVLLMVPLAGGASALDLTSSYLSQRQAVEARIDRDEWTLRREFLLPDVHVALRVYDRKRPPARQARCE